MTTNGYPINKNGKVIKHLPYEVVLNTFQGQTIKNNGNYLFFRFKRGGLFIYSFIHYKNKTL